MNQLGIIVAACLLSGFLSLALAGWLAFRLPSDALGGMIAFATGTLLAAALLDILPEAFSLGIGQHRQMFATMLASLLGFYLLERASLLRPARADSARANQAAPARAAIWVVLLGDTAHNFVDGVLIAAAFTADPWLGVTTTLAIVAHEIPQELGDFVLMRAAGWTQGQAILANGGSSLAAVFGGFAGWLSLDASSSTLPYVLAIAASSFLYMAVANLLPLLNKRHLQDNFATQSVLLAAGVVCVPLVAHLLH